TLSIAQELYEKHKVLTYPRTDARHLPEDYINTVRQTLATVAESNNYQPFARRILDSGWVRPNKRIFDNTKISDHFAIIPTLEQPRGLNDVQQKIYDLVTRRFLAVFFPAAEYQITTRITEVEGHHFKTEGKVLVNPGWLAVYGKDAQGEDATLVPVAAGEKPLADKVEPVGLQTKPPPRYSEATLLTAMESAGKLVEDEELRDAMSQRGLGTPATRAAIIEGLLGEKYLVREGRELIPTAKAFQLMTLLHGLGVSELTHPELTGEWEYKLAQMERGRLTREEFMREIAQMTHVIVKRAREYDSDTVPGEYAVLKTPCPNCGGTVSENYRRFACEKCSFSFTKTPGARMFESTDEVETLLAQRQIGPLQGFRSKMGRPFAAILRIAEDDELRRESGNGFKLEFDFGQGQGNDDEAEDVDFSGQESIGPCPKCAHPVFEHGMSYTCENTPRKLCDFRSGKVILQQEISREQMTKLLTQGRTDLLTNFVSNRNGRKFKAYLAKQADGKIGFEFEARAAKPGAKSAKTTDDETGDTAVATKKTAATKTATAKRANAATVKAVATKSAPAKKTATKTAARKTTRKAA
ncbi:MAG TPA: DNA topoisomerase, partial [Burkholderiaceae bacterium]|nr:DNA topoisomerase [Burkholderiaceae bacterium]